MLRAKGITIGAAMVVMMFILCLPTKSYAWWSLGIGTSHGHGVDHGRGWDRDHHHYYGHPYFGLHVSLLPQECYTVWSGGIRYYYCDGYYYRHDRVDYVVVNPPVGAVLTSVPVTYQPVLINGTTYYTNNGAYYIYTSSGYQVVPPPVVNQQQVLQAPTVAQQAQPVAATQVTATADDNYFTVNIPNDKGGYNQVTLKRSANGFVGPQGEFYPSFPSVSQLKAMYVK
jgi:hypothetical protein